MVLCWRCLAYPCSSLAQNLSKDMQEENYTKIPNEVLEALAKTKLSNYELRYLWVVIRKTLGWNKQSDYIANSQFVQATGIKKWSISKIQRKLIERKIVVKIGNKLRISLNYGEWLEKPKKLPKEATTLSRTIEVANSVEEVANLDNKVAILDGHKEYLPKNTKQRKEVSVFSKKELAELYKKGDRSYKPYFWGDEMRWWEEKWWVIKAGDPKWKEFALGESEIEWQ